MEIKELFDIKRKDKHLLSIMKSHLYKFIKFINKDDLENIGLICIWNTLKKTGDSELFIPYLCVSIKWECMKFLKTYNRGRISYSILHENIEENNHSYFDEIIESLNDKYKRILKKRFIENKTLHEIGKEESCSHEYINILIKQALEKLKNSV